MKELPHKINEIKKLATLLDSTEQSQTRNESIEEGKLQDILEKYRTETKNIDYIETGFKSIDSLIKGFTFGEIVVIGARPAMGKTGLLLNMALNISAFSENKIPSLYIDLEYSLKGTAKRILTILDKDTNQNIDKLSDSNIFMLSSNGYIDEIIERIEYYNKNEDVRIVFIDYIQLVNSTQNKIYRDLQLTTIIRKLKQIARTNNISIIFSSQLNRNVEYRAGERRPMLSDLRDSGSLEQEVDKVLFLHRAEYYGLTEDWDGNSTAGVAEIIVAKNRSGKTGEVYIHYNKESSAFENFDDKYLKFGELDTNIILKSEFDERDCDF